MLALCLGNHWANLGEIYFNKALAYNYRTLNSLFIFKNALTYDHYMKKLEVNANWQNKFWMAWQTTLSSHSHDQMVPTN